MSTAVHLFDEQQIVRPPARHAGDLSARDALTILLENEDAVLVDVRTDYERWQDGPADLGGLANTVVTVPWSADFATRLERLVEAARRPVFFVSTHGRRSRLAARAAAGAGYRLAINVADGLDALSHPSCRPRGA